MTRNNQPWKFFARSLFSSLLNPVSARNLDEIETARSFHCITHWHPGVDLYQLCRAFTVLRQEDHQLPESAATESAGSRLSSKAFPLKTSVIVSAALSVTSRVAEARKNPTLRCCARHCNPDEVSAPWPACALLDRPANVGLDRLVEPAAFHCNLLEVRFRFSMDGCLM
jgi:hypothetical protein